MHARAHHIHTHPHIHTHMHIQTHTHHCARRFVVRRCVSLRAVRTLTFENERKQARRFTNFRKTRERQVQNTRAPSTQSPTPFFILSCPVARETRVASTDPETRVSSPARTGAQGEHARTGRRMLTALVRARCHGPRVGRGYMGNRLLPSSA